MGRRLLEAGLRNFVLFDRQREIGGNWTERDPSGHSSAYEGVRSISSVRRMAIPGFPFPPGTPDYPSRHELLAYLKSFARSTGLEPYLRLNSAVSAVAPVNLDGKQVWRVSLASGESSPFDAVCVCNGHHSVPLIPQWDGHFSGQLLHAHDFRTSFAFADRRVLIVGGGNSAADIATDVARRCGDATLSLRRGYHVLPRHIFGIPSDEFHARIHWLPDALIALVAPLLFRFAQGRAIRHMPPPDHPLFATHPLIHSELPKMVASGAITLRGAIESVQGKTFTFGDGSRDDFDVVIACTGYQISFPFLELDATELPPNTDLPLHVFHPRCAGLYFVGLIQPNGSIWPLADLQARLVARHLQGLTSAIFTTKTNYRSTYLASPRHHLEVDYFRYRRALERALQGSH